MIPTINKFNNKLEQYGLNNFHHRFIIKSATFTHKIVNSTGSPVVLKEKLKTKAETKKFHMVLRNNRNFIE